MKSLNMCSICRTFWRILLPAYLFFTFSALAGLSSIATAHPAGEAGGVQGDSRPLPQNEAPAEISSGAYVSIPSFQINSRFIRVKFHISIFFHVQNKMICTCHHVTYHPYARASTVIYDVMMHYFGHHVDLVHARTDFFCFLILNCATVIKVRLILIFF